MRTGTKALRGAASTSDNAQCVQTVSTVAGTPYTLTGWVRGSYVYIGIIGGASTWTPSATDWQQLTVTFTATGSTVQVFLHGWYGTGDYYADDLSLQGQGGTGTVPGVPGTPSAGTVTNTSIALSRGASSGTVTGYRVYEGTTQRAQETGTTATITGLTACTTHTYAVAAYNSVGESAKSGTATVTTTGCTTGVPGTPANPSVTGATNTSLSLAWGASSGTVTGYRIYEGRLERLHLRQRRPRETCGPPLIRPVPWGGGPRAAAPPMSRCGQVSGMLFGLSVPLFGECGRGELVDSERLPVAAGAAGRLVPGRTAARSAAVGRLLPRKALS